MVAIITVNKIAHLSGKYFTKTSLKYIWDFDFDFSVISFTAIK